MPEDGSAESLVARAGGEIARAADVAELERIRTAYLGRKGVLTGELRALVSLPPEARREAGARLNQLKGTVECLLVEREAALAGTVVAGPRIDVTLPGRVPLRGSVHPVTAVIGEITAILRGLGFELAEGRETDTDYYNFEVLNHPPDHPARDMHDTFFLSRDVLLRTHTSSVWAHVMEKRGPPLRVFCPGRAYRRDAVDASHSPVFHQVEGLWMDERCGFSDLKGVLDALLKGFFGEGTVVRFSPSYFPFTEPSAEVSIRCSACEGAGCRTCGRSGWLELLGAGMVNPKVLAALGGPWTAAGIRGFAFGMGVERLAMMKYGITDMRWFYENDLRLLAGFRG